MTNELRLRLSRVIAPPFRPVWRRLKRGDVREVWLSGGRGSGKSSFAAVAVLALLLLHPERHAIVYRRVAATLRESVYGQLLWAIDQLGLTRFVKCSLSPLELTLLPTGQRILFRGMDDAAKSKSIKLQKGHIGVLWLEELGEMESLESMRTVQLSVLRGGAGVTICSYNPPPSMRAWVNQEALRDEPGRLIHRSDYRALPRAWLGEAFLGQAEALRRSDEAAWRHVFLGEPATAGGQVFTRLALRPPTDADASGELLCGLDFGFAADPDALVIARYSRKRRALIIVDELVARGLTTDALAQAIRERLLRTGISPRDALITCDCADPRMIAELRALGLCCISAKKGAGSIMSGIRWLQSLNELAIDPARCPVAAREFSLCEYLRDESGFLPQLRDRDNHTIDALRYACEREAAAPCARWV